jgi:hypothetical protein
MSSVYHFQLGLIPLRKVQRRRLTSRLHALAHGLVARSFGGAHSHHRFVNCPGSRPNSLIASALNGQIALALSSGARTRDTSCTAFTGSGSATTNGTYSGSPSPSRRVVTTTSCPAEDSNVAIKTNMRALGTADKPIGCLIQRDQLPNFAVTDAAPSSAGPATDSLGTRCARISNTSIEAIFRAAPWHRQAIA